MYSRNKFFTIYLFHNQNWEKVQPELDKHLLDSLFSFLKEGSVPLRELGAAMSLAIATIGVPNEVVFKNWQKNRTEFPDYGAVVASIANASEVSTYDKMIEAYLKWYVDIAGVVDTLVLKAPRRQYLRQDLLKKIRGLFLQSNKLAFLYEPFEEFVLRFNKRYLRGKELNYAWNESLYQSILNGKDIRNVSAAEPDSKKALSVEGLRETLNELAGMDTLQAIFRSALRPAVRSDVLRKGPNLELAVSFSDGTELPITIQTTIQEFENKKGKKVPYVTVQEGGVSCTIRKSGNKGFDYEIKDVLIFDYELADGTVYVDYEYKIALREKGNDQTVSEQAYKEGGKSESSPSHALGKTSVGFASTGWSSRHTRDRTSGTEVSYGSTFVKNMFQGKSRGSSVRAHGGVEALAFTISARLKSSNIGSETLDVESAQTVDRLRSGEQTIDFSTCIKQAGLNWKR